ncbi:hypothetical protein [Aquimarina sediminis]|uniref:hypothetical protein n=1 Tax=Aquimarina sediminis TaxID=2070536 RepID=UPI000CA0424C|nr:hypothetical protein [Aquimarina sediminis]
MSKIKNIEWLLRLGVFLTFLGHGILSIGKNPHWIPYIEAIGMSRNVSLKLLTIIGCLDVIVALIILIKPNKYVILWAFVWAFSTALIRPISGESIWTFIERGSNWVTPLVLYFYIIEVKPLSIESKKKIV